MDLKEKRNTLSRDEAKLVRRCIDRIECELIDVLPDMANGVKISKKQSSFSPTVTLNTVNGNNLTIKVDARLRTAREALEFAVRLTDDDQLALGWDENASDPGTAPNGTQSAATH